LDRLYGVQLDIKDYIEHKNGNKAVVEYDDYIQHPEKYQSNFHQTVSYYIKWQVMDS
jgi:hypothetical protein